MSEETPMRVIARMHSDFPTKFGVPRQSGLVPQLKARVVFEPEFRSLEAVRGLEEFSHIWLIWGFSQSQRQTWSPTVRPPRLGGNERLGVFATRSPYRPNPIGLSSVALERVELDGTLGPVLWVAGADLMDGSPIYDIKPYIPYGDSRPEATGGFTDRREKKTLDVVVDQTCESLIPPEKREALFGVLAQDPRPPYQDDPQRMYGMEFGAVEVKFRVTGGILTICEVRPRGKAD